MIKKFGIKYTLKYYNILQLVLFGIVLILSNSHIFEIFCSYCNINEQSQYYSFFKFSIPFSLIALWFTFVFNNCRDKRYTFLTGRKYGIDHRRFDRNYHDLVQYFKDSEPHKLDTTSFPQINWRDAKGIVFGLHNKRLIQIPSDSECNIAVFGPPGSGKTSGLAIINAMTFQGSVLAVDIKGDIYNFVSQHSDRKILRFCPDSTTALQDSIHFDPLYGLDQMDETDRKLYIESISVILIPEEGGEAGNYFTSRGRKMFQGITHLILYNKPDASFPDIVHAILEGNIFDWVTKGMKSNCITAKELLSSFYQNSERNVTSAYDALCTALICYSNPVLDVLLTKSENNASIDLLEDGTDLYLQISQEHLDTYAPLFTLLIQNLSTALTKRKDSSTGIKNRPVLLLLDEFPQLTFSYKLINSNLSTLRSKSVICMIIQQNLSQLEYRYQPAGVRSILGNCNCQIILGSNDINSSKIFSDTFGDKKVLKVSNSKTKSKRQVSGRSVQETLEKVYPPEYFGDLTSIGNIIIYIKGKYCECKKLNCYKN